MIRSSACCSPASLIAVDIFGRATKGAQRWVILGPISFQPSEFVKLAVILLGAHYLGQLMEQGKRPHLLRRDTGMAFWGNGLSIVPGPDPARYGYGSHHHDADDHPV